MKMSNRKYKQSNPECNPPYECSNCKYSDCIRNGEITSGESEFLKAANLPFGRPGKQMFFTRIDDIV